ncbi:translation termination factor GTPase eRF3 [Aspergillus homomorphus CBS 101889]|uniref:Elongation factor 1-alpha n=1 Tax=Aspergillus homomorphus (strain CBS 101889) TaxID=1450537 RepID=A0A395I8F1_ASPHC|nr:hypothetical protein BO97DRAFT_402705 [Aspergillus homomorphus CBS 101889]RAL16256.1 hypothetical protein BO97DRAFT_402705 [Aspergillus homomorphus CBS 101889]
MANQAPDSWEDELSQQTENVNLNNNRRPQQFSYQGSSFTPGAASFTPGAAAFVPGQQSYGYPQYNQQQYGYPQQQPYGQYGAQYGAYAQQPGHNQYYNQQQYGGYQQQQQQQQQQQPQQTQQQPRPAAESKPAAPKVLSIGGDAAPKAKVLSIGGASDSPNAPKTKVLSIGTPTSSATSGTTTPGDTKGTAAADAAAKVTASKAIDKTEKKAEAKAAASGKSSPAPASGRSSPGRASPTRAEIAKAARAADVVAQEQKADVDEATLNELYGELEKKEHVNVVFIGHVDAGKSTLGGAILVSTGMVDERTLEKYKRDAKEAGRETWYLSWALDLNPEERAEGKTVEVGRAHFQLNREDGVERHFSILDAPGHKAYVHHMIGGATQADVGCLVISARKGEYETGFEKGGQTREHALLARNTGVRKLVIAVNKMDDPTVEWSQARFKECTVKVGKYLMGLGYKSEDLTFMPISAQTLVNLKDRVPKEVCPWYDGPSLLEYLSKMELPPRKLNAPFMMALSAKYRDMGTMVEGKIDSGIVKKQQNLIVMPSKTKVEVAALYGETEDEIATGSCGDQVRMRLRGVEEEDLLPGFVLCSPRRLVHCVSAFEAKIKILEMKSILSAGFNCVMHVHSAVEEVTVAALLHKLEPGTGRRSKRPPPFANKGMTVIARIEVTSTAGQVCVEPFSYSEQMGRFTLRDQGQTIAIGMITKLIENDEVVAE